MTLDFSPPDDPANLPEFFRDWLSGLESEQKLELFVYIDGANKVGLTIMDFLTPDLPEEELEEL